MNNWAVYQKQFYHFEWQGLIFDKNIDVKDSIKL